MKKLVFVIAAVAVLWVGYQYLQTGEFSITPVAMSEQEQRIHDLEEALHRVDAQIAQAGRSAGLTGMDTTAGVDSLVKQKEELERQIAEAKKNLP